MLLFFRHSTSVESKRKENLVLNFIFLLSVSLGIFFLRLFGGISRGGNYFKRQNSLIIYNAYEIDLKNYTICSRRVHN